MDVVRLWKLSIRWHERGHYRLARLIKALNFQLFSAVLPVECTVGTGLTLLHRGTGTVIHPSTVIGDRVGIAHGVTLGGTGVSERCSITLEDDVWIGANAVIIAKDGVPLVIGRGAKIGPNATIVSSVPPGAVMLAPLAAPKAT